MRVNAHMAARNARGNHRLGDLIHFMGQCPAIGVTQHNPTRAAIVSRMQTLKRILWIGFIAIKEMFCIVKRLTPLRDDMLERGTKVFDILRQRNAQSSLYVEIMGFAHQTNSRSPGI